MPSTFFVYIKSSRQSINTEKIYRANIVFIHKIGSDFHGTVIKDRTSKLGKDSYHHIDRLRRCAAHLPRKTKKRITALVDAQVMRYKQDFLFS